MPVWSNVDAKPHTDPDEVRSLLVRQVLHPVRWEETLRGLLAAGCDRFYEIGPGRVLAGCSSACIARWSASTSAREALAHCRSLFLAVMVLLEMGQQVVERQPQRLGVARHTQRLRACSSFASSTIRLLPRASACPRRLPVSFPPS